MSDSEEEVIYNPYEAFVNVGRHLLFRKEYSRALHYLDKAQSFEPKRVTCMLMRSTCHLYLTNNDEAIAIAKVAHEISKRNPHAILLIAEGYYRKGEFEMALKFFTNGKRVRPSIKAFSTGICKCEQAIKNNCGSELDPKLGPEMDLTDYYIHAFPVSWALSKNSILTALARCGQIRCYVFPNAYFLGQPKHPPSNVRPAPAKGSADAGKKKPEKWPEMMSPDILNALFGKNYTEYAFTRDIYRIEGKKNLNSVRSL
ncbi:unnamed protein product [Mesocestoides corti]|uniref:Outer dynein arm-docking complex subunit 4 n=1 Tax=Mesocestoides corti TaxID=53468 RepID=A0A0R3UGC4_MESCO|nr:unnamed protein product [Mesocestoides corti]